VLTDVKNTVGKYRMLEKVRRVIVAFSGGPDSVCLLHALYSLYKNRIQFYIMYVNHGLRDEKVLREEENLAKYYAVKYGLQCRIVRIQVKKEQAGIEAAARDARYAALQHYMASSCADRIALGHNSDDVVETFIMNMIRGSGAAGLGAFSPVRIPFIRPLYALRKAEIRKFVRAQKLPFSEDETNQHMEFRRNLVRHKIIPELVKINPELHAAVHRSIELIRMDDACLDDYAERTYRETTRKQNDRVVLDMKKLLSYNPAVIGRVVRRAIKESCGGLEGFESKHIAEIAGLKDKPSGKQIDLPKQLIAQRQFDEIVIMRKQGSKKRRIPVNPRNDKIVLDSHIVRVHTEASFDLKSRKKGCEVFDLDALAMPLVFRTRYRGDNLVTRAGKKMLKKIYSEHKIPPQQRADLLMLCDQKGILLIPGVVRAFRGFVESKTKRFLVVDYEHTA
jgi:tRNA(Ile)-lysidine synthase